MSLDMINRRGLIFTALAALAPRLATAHSFTRVPIVIGHPWAPPAAGDSAPVYLVLATKGTSTDRLTGAETTIAERVEIRDSGGHALPFLEIAPKRPFALRPGKSYLALVGLKHPLALGTSFPLTLRFEKAGAAEVTFLVEKTPGD